MKRLLPALCVIALFTAFGPIPSAQAWWWHHHAKSSSGSSASSAAEPSSAKPSKPPKHQKTPKAHKDKTQPGDGSHLYSIPKSVGWWHKMPGPAGAGA